MFVYGYIRDYYNSNYLKNKNMKNYIYIILGVSYVTYYFLNQENSYFLYIRENVAYGDVLLSYFNALVGFFAVLGTMNLVNKVLEKLFIRLSKKTETELDDLVGEFIIKFINLAKYIFALYVVFYLAKTPVYIDILVEKATSVLIIIIFLSLFTSFVNLVFQKELILKSKLKAVSRTLLPFINKVTVIFIWIIGTITIIGNLGYDVSALIAGAGIGGLAVALAAQKSLTNVFGAITILLNKPFKIGDYVAINGHFGVVKEIGLSYLTLKDKMGHQIMIPNETIISTSIENLSVRENRRTDFSIGLVYGTTQAKMKKGVKILEDILEKYVEDKTASGYRVNFDMFGDFSLNINATYFSLHNKVYKDYIKQKEDINLSIKEQFEKAGLDMAFPTQELIIKKEDKKKNL
ncbi:mechanosensitive ion channel family protein [Candidatus Gracilibacteria bacterium 28_42_T64]|nr:mechanosensitive ion channel family protein [Candidatus Gracilibacteria bacterium 28_42_T64]